VTVKSIDEKVPSITVTTEDGRVVSRTVQDKSKLANVKPGDKIDITYTQAMLVNIEAVK
jgi:Cu/Ag efflux protein CusF